MDKPKLSFWQKCNMSFGFLGIQFGFGLQSANMSRIFETIGADIDKIPILWIAAPLTGLIVQPIIGHASDKTWNRFGRRRPFFLVGAVFASLALLFMPYSSALWIAAGMLWILDASINISMEPFRAFVGDMLPSSQRTKGFAMQSFFIGLGAVVASALPYMLTNWCGVENTAAEGIIPNTVKLSFIIGAAVFIAAVAYTVFTTKEYSPEELAAFEKAKDEFAKEEVEPARIPNFFKNGLIWSGVGVLLTIVIFGFQLEQELYVLGLGLVAFGVLQLLSKFFLDRQKSNGLTEVLTDLFNMPKTMSQLAVVQFFTWLALFSMWIYATSGVTSHIYGATDVTSKAYNDGADWVGFLFAIYNAFAAITAFFLPLLAKKTSRKTTHAIALVLGGIGLISFFFVKDPMWLIASMVLVGFSWASILSMPYAILAGALPSNKMGTYMGIFNFFITIPQILAATILGFMVNHLFGGQTILALVFGGVSMIIAAVAVLFVDDNN
ncbi:MAG: MFS transporter [Bacteroidales bacterium]|jgi:maltose/moltooligosaccharide transporter|nr:MFS transporter [Bacteroidales bacterium]